MTEQQKYKVLRKIGSVEIRRYDACVMADVIVRGEYRNATNLGFRPLVNYISRHSIAMTAPVVQELEAADSWRVSFVMPADKTLADLPIPPDQQVTLRQVPEHTAAAITFAGVTTPNSIADHEAKLRQTLASAGIRAVGEIRIARFDPPWKPGFLRRNEVVLAVEL